MNEPTRVTRAALLQRTSVAPIAVMARRTMLPRSGHAAVARRALEAKWLLGDWPLALFLSR